MPVSVVNYGPSITFTNSVYLDSNFIINAGNRASAKYNTAATLLGNLIAQNISLLLTTLAIDEYLWVLLRAHYRADNNGVDLSQQTLKSNPSIIQQYYHIISNPLIALLGQRNISIVSDNNLTREITAEALKLMQHESLLPRDAFHLAYIIKLNIPSILTSDRDFDNLNIPYYNLTVYKY